MIVEILSYNNNVVQVTKNIWLQIWSYNLIDHTLGSYQSIGRTRWHPFKLIHTLFRNYECCKASKISFINVIGYKPFLVILFTFQNSRQNLYSPFGFLILTIGFDQLEQEGSNIPFFDISSISLFIFSFTLKKFAIICPCNYFINLFRFANLKV